MRSGEHLLNSSFVTKVISFYKRIIITYVDKWIYVNNSFGKNGWLDFTNQFFHPSLHWQKDLTRLPCSYLVEFRGSNALLSELVSDGHIFTAELYSTQF